jgi:hypothetical protein
MSVSSSPEGTTTVLWVRLGMDSDRIHTDTNPDVTIYHILFRIRIRIRIFRIRIAFEYLLDL